MIQRSQTAPPTAQSQGQRSPDDREISAPQPPEANTWIELMHDQNQRDVLKYAHAIVDNSLPPGVLMIDDNWKADDGTLITGPVQETVDVPLGHLLYFERQQRPEAAGKPASPR